MMIRRTIHRDPARARLPTVLALALGTALAAPAAAQDRDMQAYLSETRTIARQGRHQEALERTIWFHEHALEYQPSMAGVRLSFALRDWDRLGEIYPPAKTALLATIDSTHARLLRNPTDRRLFNDMAGFYRHSDSEARTIELFERIAAGNPEAAAIHWRVVVGPAIDSKRLDVLQKYGVDLLAQFQQRKAIFDLELRRETDQPELEARMRPMRENSLVTESLKLIGVALAMGQPDLAKTIQTRALELVVDQRLLTAVP